jgi:hypothetical protein
MATVADERNYAVENYPPAAQTLHDNNAPLGRRCVYSKETNVTKTLRGRVGAEPRKKQWFTSQNTSQYLQRNMATTGMHDNTERKSFGYSHTSGGAPPEIADGTRFDKQNEHRIRPSYKPQAATSADPKARGRFAGQTNMMPSYRQQQSAHQETAQLPHQIQTAMTGDRPHSSFFDRSPNYDAKNFR